eukprot:TRINITY_DN47282_c0_g1_i1.p1 TRINITY_DN47282_c0_g1~~TRINITY_DN47282_c0_g1_i1.p1  ORF type:complete len:298 (-),score=46.94 TRINITY_DN47282_c0_g1_i1:118-1011(-)
MGDSSNGKATMLGASLVAAGICAWLLKRNKVKKAQTGTPDALHWEQVAPSGTLPIDVKEFGETGLNTRLISGRLSSTAMKERAQEFLSLMNTRRTMRFYSPDPIPAGVLEACVATAGTAPSGAHHQPWFFALVHKADVKKQIRELVEAEEKVNYERRMRKSWVNDLSHMTGADADKRLRSDDGEAPLKPYLTEAPAIIALFKQNHCFDADGNKVDNYYVTESCGIAAGMLIAALHNVGLATLTSTPMGAEAKIREILGRPDNEKLFLLMPVGYPAADATVPFRTPLRKPDDLLYKKY